MFEALRDEIEGLQIPLDGGALAEAIALRDRLDARIACAVADFEAAGLHELDGAVNMAAWLRLRTGADRACANRLTMQGRKLAQLPVLRGAFLDGEVSGGQVDAILANIRLGHVDRFASHEAELVPLLASMEVDDVRTAMVDWRAKADALDDDGLPAERDNELYLSSTLDGRGELRGSFDADMHALLEAGLRVADSNDFDLTPAERRADAMATVFQHFLDHQRIGRGGRHRPHLNVVVTDDAARYLDTGLRASASQLGVLHCDSAVHRVVVDGTSAILDYGRATRTWPVDLYNAIAIRDRGCRWPGCDRPASWCDVHHLTEWADGGATSIDNGAMLCRRHHRTLHSNRGFSAKLLPDGTFEVTDKTGQVEASHPPGTTTQPFW